MANKKNIAQFLFECFSSFDFIRQHSPCTRREAAQMYGTVDTKEDVCPGKTPGVGPAVMRIFYTVPNPADAKRPAMTICNPCFQTYVAATLEADVPIQTFRGSTAKHGCSSNNAMFIEKDMTVSIINVQTNSGLPLSRLQDAGPNQPLRIAVYMPSGTEYKVQLRYLGGGGGSSNGNGANGPSPTSPAFRVPNAQFVNGEVIVDESDPAKATSYTDVCELTTLASDYKTRLTHITPPVRPADSTTAKEQSSSDANPEKHLPAWMMDTSMVVRWIHYPIAPPKIPMMQPFSLVQPSAPSAPAFGNVHLQQLSPASHPQPHAHRHLRGAQNNGKPSDRSTDIVPRDLIIEFHSPFMESDQHRKDMNLSFAKQYIQTQYKTLQPEYGLTVREVERLRGELELASKRQQEQEAQLARHTQILQALASAA
jgi:hypothetical protein